MSGTEVMREAALRMGRDPLRQFERRMPKPEPARRASEAEHESSGRWIGRFAIAAGALMLAAALALISIVGPEAWSGSDFTDDTSTIEAVIGDDVLLVPANAIRFRRQRRNGEAGRIDLHLKWPELSGYRVEDDAAFRSPAPSQDVVLITIAPRTMRLDMSGRIEPIYSRYFEGPPQPAGHGLVKRMLASSAGFADEDLYYEADSPHPFAARCIRQGASSAAPYCLRDIHVGRNLSATYRFHIGKIGEWMALEAGIRARLHEMLGR